MRLFVIAVLLAGCGDVVMVPAVEDMTKPSQFVDMELPPAGDMAHTTDMICWCSGFTCTKVDNCCFPEGMNCVIDSDCCPVTANGKTAQCISGTCQPHYDM